MKTFDVVIEGSTPILFDNPAGMSEPTPGKGAPKLTAQEQAERGCYWMSDKSSLMFPGDNVHAALKVVAPGYKYSGKKTLGSYVAGSVVVVPEEIPFGTKSYAIDTRRIVNKSTKGASLKSRPKLKSWKLPFQILIEDDFPVKPDPGPIVKEMLEEAGRRVGIGSYRPTCKGRFGKFIVTKFSEIKGRS